MKLFLISQSENNDYDTYDSAVVAAESEAIARTLDPRNGEPFDNDEWGNRHSGWCNSPHLVKVEYLGEARAGMPQGVICASFNAG